VDCFVVATEFVLAGEAIITAVFAPWDRARERFTGACAVSGAGMSFEVRPTLGREVAMLLSAWILIFLKKVAALVICN